MQTWYNFGAKVRGRGGGGELRTCMHSVSVFNMYLLLLPPLGMKQFFRNKNYDKDLHVDSFEIETGMPIQGYHDDIKKTLN